MEYPGEWDLLTACISVSLNDGTDKAWVFLVRESLVADSSANRATFDEIVLEQSKRHPPGPSTEMRVAMKLREHGIATAAGNAHDPFAKSAKQRYGGSQDPEEEPPPEAERSWFLTVLLLFAMAVFATCLGIIVPRYEKTFAAVEAPLPQVTVLLLRAARLFRMASPLFVPIMLATAWFAGRSKRVALALIVAIALLAMIGVYALVAPLTLTRA